MGEQSLEHGAFRADAAAPALVHGAHFEQPNPAVCPAEFLRHVVDARVDGEETAARPRPGPCARFDLLAHPDDRAQLGPERPREAERQRQAGRRIGVDREGLAAPARRRLREQRGERGLSDSAFSRYRQFHSQTSAASGCWSLAARVMASLLQADLHSPQP